MIPNVSERLIPNPVLEQPNQFTGVAGDGQYILGAPCMIAGLFLKSAAGMTVNWEVYAEIHNPADPANPVEWQLLAQTGVAVTIADLEWKLPSKTKINIRTNVVTGANLRAQILLEPIYKGTGA